MKLASLKDMTYLRGNGQPLESLGLYIPRAILSIQASKSITSEAQEGYRAPLIAGIPAQVDASLLLIVLQDPASSDNHQSCVPWCEHGHCS